MFSLICVCINAWVNNREAGDLRRYHSHYDVFVMYFWLSVCLSELLVHLSGNYADNISNGLNSPWHSLLTTLMTQLGDKDMGHLAQIMACCLTAPNHYLTQCWLTINEVLWHSFYIFVDNQDINPQVGFEIHAMYTARTFFMDMMHCHRGPISHMMTSSNGNICHVIGHLCGAFTGPRWIPRTKASDAEL